MSLEAEMEAALLTPEEEADLIAMSLVHHRAMLAAVDAAKTPTEVFATASSGAMAAFVLNDYARAKDLAIRALAMAAAYEGTWDYGNALHSGHEVLGLLALESGDLEAAVRELHAAGDTPGSPQLASFGPSMRLAKALLSQDQASAVLLYLQKCRIFWEEGETWIELWSEMIRDGRRPRFPLHSFL